MSFIEQVIETTSNMIAQLIASFIVIFIWMLIIVLAILGIFLMIITFPIGTVVIVIYYLIRADNRRKEIRNEG